MPYADVTPVQDFRNPPQTLSAFRSRRIFRPAPPRAAGARPKHLMPRRSRLGAFGGSTLGAYDMYGIPGSPYADQYLGKFSFKKIAKSVSKVARKTAGFATGGVLYKGSLTAKERSIAKKTGLVTAAVGATAVAAKMASSGGFAKIGQIATGGFKAVTGGVSKIFGGGKDGGGGMPTGDLMNTITGGGKDDGQGGGIVGGLTGGLFGGGGAAPAPAGADAGYTPEPGPGIFPSYLPPSFPDSAVFPVSPFVGPPPAVPFQPANPVGFTPAPAAGPSPSESANDAAPQEAGMPMMTKVLIGGLVVFVVANMLTGKKVQA